ncbi:hypothetical protein HYZ78_04540 [Candidatus Microgenomates bacterium]|nr:hypothetical protein [Candidatus Microgenomates bacterium]
MPHLSKRRVDLKTQRLLIDALNSLFSNLNKNDSAKVLSALLTRTEKLMIAKRIGASLLLSEKMTEVEISEALKLSTATVSKFNLIIRAGNQQTWNFILKKLERWHNFAVLKEGLKEAGLYALKKFSRGMAGKI